jgi:uncharacterized protein (DUF169 family)
MKDLGFHLSLCQAFALSRMKGMCIAQLLEDMWCHEPIIGLGIAEPPQYWLDGNTRRQYFRTQEDAMKSVSESPRLPAGKYIGIMSAPLKTTDFDPDLVIIYCDPAQLSFLLRAKRATGSGQTGNFASELSSGAACLFATVPVLQTKKCQFTLPCSGDRRAGLAQNDEVVFTMPRERLDGIAKMTARFDFRSIESSPMEAMPEHPLPESYAKVTNLLGIKTGGRIIPGI